MHHNSKKMSHLNSLLQVVDNAIYSQENYAFNFVLANFIVLVMTLLYSNSNLNELNLKLKSNFEKLCHFRIKIEINYSILFWHYILYNGKGH